MEEEREGGRDEHTWRQNMLVSSAKKIAMPPCPYSTRVLLPTTSTRNAWGREKGREERKDFRWKKDEIMVTHTSQSSCQVNHTHSNSGNIRIAHSGLLKHFGTVVEDLWVKKYPWRLMSVFSLLLPFLLNLLPHKFHSNVAQGVMWC